MSLIVLNWKELLSVDEAKDLLNEYLAGWNERLASKDQLVICPSNIAFGRLSTIPLPAGIYWGVQNLAPVMERPITGENGGAEVAGLGGKFALLNHVERELVGEDHSQLADRILNAVSNNLTPIICATETQLEEIIGVLLVLSSEEAKSKLLIAFEPSTAVGGVEPWELKKVEAMITVWRDRFERELKCEVGFLYGGGIRAEDLRSFLGSEALQGVLLGRLSLQPELVMQAIQ